MMLGISVFLLHNHSRERIPFVHLDDLWLATDLWVDRHGKDETVIRLICKVELLKPQSLYFVSADVAVLRFVSLSVLR